MVEAISAAVCAGLPPDTMPNGAASTAAEGAAGGSSPAKAGSTPEPEGGTGLLGGAAGPPWGSGAIAGLGPSSANAEPLRLDFFGRSARAILSMRR